MHMIIYVALFASIYGVLNWGVPKTLVRVYLPVLLLLPDTYHAITPGLPDPSFNQAAMIPLAAMAFMLYGKNWKPSINDLMMICFAGTVFYSEFRAAGYSEAQNLLFVMLFGVISPYFVARWVIVDDRMDVQVAKVFVLILTGLAIFGFFEAKMGFNPFLATLGKFFPGQGYWVTTFRHGLARVAGPYAHAILAGVIMCVAFRFQRWLQWGGFWEPKWSFWPKHPGTKAQTITAALVLGSLMTVARGPWLGGIAGGALVWISRAKKKWLALALVSFVGVVGGVGGKVGMDAYLDIKPGQEITDSQESALYRAELTEKYKNIVLDNLWFGWGRNTWPKVGGMSSIDNYYLLLSLMHGLTATLLLVALMAWTMLRCLIRGMKEPARYNSLSFCFLGIMALMFVSLGTVYLGENLIPIFFFVAGWAEGHLQRPLMSEPSMATENAQQVVQETKTFRFKHVIS